MNELLRKANELVEARECARLTVWSPEGSDWGPFLGHYDYADHTVKVIKGYQDLLRRIVDECNTDYRNNLEPLIEEASESIPEVNHE